MTNFPSLKTIVTTFSHLECYRFFTPLLQEPRPHKLKKDHIKTRKRRCRGDELDRAGTLQAANAGYLGYSPSTSQPHQNYVLMRSRGMDTVTAHEQQSPVSETLQVPVTTNTSTSLY